jgi:putative FmdB family regulatory protein
MPTYDYRCAACGHRFEVVHGVNAPGPEVCPVCGSTSVRKTITAPAVHYKGSGWAKKERRSGGPKKAPAAGGSSSDTEATSDAATDKSPDKGTDKGTDKGSERASDKGSDQARRGADKGAAAEGNSSKAASSGSTGTD